MAGLWQLMEAVLDGSEPDLDNLGLTPKTFFLLTAVEEHPFPAELARRMHLPPPTATYMIKQLEERGLLGRRAEPGVRKFRLFMTVAGMEALERGWQTLSAILVERLRRLDHGDLVSFDRIVKRLAETNGVSQP